MATITISLPDDQLARLRQYAVSSGRSLDDVVSEAVGIYLAQNLEPATSQSRAEPPPDRLALDPRVRFFTAIDGAQVAVPPSMTPDEVLALLAAPSPRARGDYLREWLISRGARVTEPPPGPPSPEWQAEVEAALARIRAQVPDDMTPEEIEQLITEVSEEGRQERIAKRDAEWRR